MLTVPGATVRFRVLPGVLSGCLPAWRFAAPGPHARLLDAAGLAGPQPARGHAALAFC